MATPTHYEVLGVESGASLKEIKKAYRAYLMDSTDPLQLQTIEKAYCVLSDSVLRAEYDQSLPEFSTELKLEPLDVQSSEAVGNSDKTASLIPEKDVVSVIDSVGASKRRIIARKRISPVVSMIVGGLAAIPLSGFILKTFADIDIFGFWQKPEVAVKKPEPGIKPGASILISESETEKQNVTEVVGSAQAATGLDTPSQSEAVVGTQGTYANPSPLYSDSSLETEVEAEEQAEDREEIETDDESATFTKANPETVPDARYPVPDGETQEQILMMAAKVFTAEFETAAEEKDPAQKSQLLLDLGREVFEAGKDTFPLDVQNADSRYVMFDASYKLLVQSGNEKVSNEVLGQMVTEFAIEEWEIRSYAIEFWHDESARSTVPLGIETLPSHFKLFQMATIDAGNAYVAGAEDVGKKLFEIGQSLIALIDHSNFRTRSELELLNATYIKMFNHLKTLDKFLVEGGRPDIAYEYIFLARDIALRGKGEAERKECEERLKVLKDLKEQNSEFIKATRVLKTNPTDAKANNLVGFVLMRNGEIEAGLVCLSFSDNERVRLVAQEELKFLKASQENQLIENQQDLTRRWLKLYDNPVGIDAAFHDVLGRRALFWLGRTVNTFTGFDKLNMEKRIKELEGNRARQ
ncbi:MAG: hypothetical protein CMJ82_12140 [Planctomycetaceae bacterium]|nr:hypothetical protein [Planctomycetaceae bacterium]